MPSAVAICAKVARHKRLPIWSSRLRSVLVNSNWRLDMTSDGISSKVLGEPLSPEMSAWRGATVSTQGFSAIMLTSFVMKGAILAGGTTPAGKGDENNAIHAGKY